MDNFFNLYINPDNPGVYSGTLITDDEGHNTLDYIYKAFGVSSNISKTGFSQNGYISQGAFIIKSLTTDIANYNPDLFENQKYMHFTNKSIVSGWTSGNIDTNDLVYDDDFDINKFKTVLEMYSPTTEIKQTYNLEAMYYANYINGSETITSPNPITCSIKSMTNDYEHDLWSYNSSGVARDMPVISKHRDRTNQAGTTYNDAEDIKVSHVQQASYTINAISTNISDIGNSTWGKKPQTFYEDIVDNTLPIGDGNSKYNWYQYPSGRTANFVDNFDNNCLHSPSDKSIMLDMIIKTPFTNDASQEFVFGVSELNSSHNDNFHRSLPFFDSSIDNWSDSYLENTKMFSCHNQFSDSISDRIYYMFCPVLFSALRNATTVTTYGYNNVFRANSYSYLNMFGLANVVATSFGGPYENFVIYSTSSNYYTISYAIDLRNIATTGAKAGKTSVNTSSSSTDVLAIANCNIYVLSISQVNTYIHAYVE